MVKITIGWGGELEGSEADIVESFVVDDHDLISIFDELMHGKGGVVGLDHSVRHLRGGHDGEGLHDSVGVLLTDLGDEEGSHAGTGTTTEGVAHLESLQAIARLGLLTDDIEDRVDQLSSLSVVTLGPVVTGTRLAKDKVVWTEDLTEWTGSN